MRVLLSVVLFAQTCIALIIQSAVAQRIGSEELPNLRIGPVKNREYANELGPSFAAWANMIKVLRIGISSTIAHYYCLDSVLIYQSLHLSLEVR